MSVASLIARGNGMFGADFMSEEQRREWLPKCASGEYVLAVAMTEPDAGSDLAGMRTFQKRLFYVRNDGLKNTCEGF